MTERLRSCVSHLSLQLHDVSQGPWQVAVLVAGIHDQRGVPQDALVVDVRVVGQDHHARHTPELLRGERD